MKTVVLEAQIRTDLGKKATNDLRRQDLVPCVLYGAGTVEHFSAHLNNVRHAIYTNTFVKVDITLNGKSHVCIVKDTQFDPMTDKVTHIDFLELVPNKRFRAQVPLRFVGTAKGVKEGGNMIQKVRKVSINTTPEAITEVIEVDVTALELGKSLRVRDIIVNEQTEIINAPSIPVATIDIPRALRSAQTKAADTGKKKK